MGLFEQLQGMFGGGESQQLQQWASGQASFADPSSPEAQQAHNLLSSAQPEHFQEAISEAVRKGDPQEYAEHLGGGGTNPLASLDPDSLKTVAGALMNRVQGSPEAGSAMGGLSNLMPGLQEKQPEQMNPAEVATMANYVRQNHPGIFAQAVGDVGQKQPGLLHVLMGHKLLTAAVAALAWRYLRR